MSGVSLTREGSVWVLSLGSDENRLHDASLAALSSALDTVEADSSPAALVLTSHSDKFFSTGIDLEGILAQHDRDYLVHDFVPRLDALLKRLALLPLPVIAAIPGHAYGGGALLAATADFRVMRADRGRFCFPEVDVKLAFTPMMQAVVQLIPQPAAVWRMAVTGVAWGGADALANGVVDAAVPAEAVLPQALAQAAALAQKDRATYGAIKRNWRAAIGSIPCKY